MSITQPIKALALSQTFLHFQSPLAKVFTTDAEYIDWRRSRTVQPQPNLSPTPSIHHHEPSFFTADHHAAKSVS